MRWGCSKLVFWRQDFFQKSSNSHQLQLHGYGSMYHLHLDFLYISKTVLILDFLLSCTLRICIFLTYSIFIISTHTIFSLHWFSFLKCVTFTPWGNTSTSTVTFLFYMKLRSQFFNKKVSFSSASFASSLCFINDWLCPNLHVAGLSPLKFVQ